MRIHNVGMLISESRINTVCFFMYPEFIQLMDDDIVSLTGLIAIIVDKTFIDDTRKAGIHVLSLSLYLLTQCQLKLRYSKTSLAQTLDYIALAKHNRAELLLIDQLVSKFTEQKIQKYISSTDT